MRTPTPMPTPTAMATVLLGEEGGEMVLLVMLLMMFVVTGFSGEAVLGESEGDALRVPVWDASEGEPWAVLAFGVSSPELSDLDGSVGEFVAAGSLDCPAEDFAFWSCDPWDPWELWEPWEPWEPCEP